MRSGALTVAEQLRVRRGTAEQGSRDAIQPHLGMAQGVTVIGVSDVLSSEPVC